MQWTKAKDQIINKARHGK